MFKNLLFILFLAFPIFLSGQNIVIQDSVLKVALLDAGIDKNFDNEISTSEALAVVDLDISFKNLTTINGIEHFSNLQKLQCLINDIDSIDLSSNKRLTYLDCSLNNLVYLNLEGLDSLQTLICSINKLDTLNTSMLTALKSIICFGNKIENFDLSNNVNLEVFNASSNKIKNISIANNINLKELTLNANFIDTLEISSNDSLVYLEVTSMPTLKKVCSDDTTNFEHITISSAGSYNAIFENCYDTTSPPPITPAIKLKTINPVTYYNQVLTIPDETLNYFDKTKLFLQVYNLHGQLVFNSRVTNHQTTLYNLSEKCLYIARLSDGNHTLTLKFIDY